MMMEIVDLTHYIKEKMTVYPGTEGPKIEQNCTVVQNGYAEKLLTMFSHTGTHIDAPGHILENAATLDDFDISKFVGIAYVLDFRNVGRKIIEVDDLKKYEGLIRQNEFILFCTGWSDYWDNEKYFDGFPVLSEESVSWLSSFKLKGLGFDVISIDPVGSENLPNHRIILSKNMIIIENLTNLEYLVGKNIIFSCMPLKIEDADGSPVRAFAITDY